MSLRHSSKTEIHRNRYKVAVDADEGRRRREDSMVEIRKNKREENLQKKSYEGLSAFAGFGLSAAQSEQDLSSEKRLMENLPNMVAGIWSEDSNSQLEATNLLRRLLSIQQNPPINDVVQSGVVPRVVKFLSSDDFPKLQLGRSPILLQGHKSTLMLSLKVVLSRAFKNFVQLVLDLAISVVKFLFVPILAVSSISEMSYCAHERKLALVLFPFFSPLSVSHQYSCCRDVSSS